MSEGSHRRKQKAVRQREITNCDGHQASQWHEQNSDGAQESISSEAPLILYTASQPHFSHNYYSSFVLLIYTLLLLLLKHSWISNKVSIFTLLNKISPPGFLSDPLKMLNFTPFSSQTLQKNLLKKKRASEFGLVWFGLVWLCGIQDPSSPDHGLSSCPLAVEAWGS